MDFHDHNQKEKKRTNVNIESTLDGSVDRNGQPAVRSGTGNWVAANLLLCKLKYNFREIDYL